MSSSLTRMLPEVAKSSVLRTVLTGLVAVDLALVWAYVWALWKAPDWSIPLVWNIGREWSLAESFTYLKWLTVVICMLLMAREPGRKALAWVALAFAVLLADDSLAIHERMGLPLANWLGVSAMLSGTEAIRPGDLGEIMMFGILGIVVYGALLVAYLRASSADRPLVVLFAGLILLLFLVASLPDIGAHIVWDNMTGYWRHRLRLILVIMEDGGEMILASTACAVAISSVVQLRRR